MGRKAGGPGASSPGTEGDLGALLYPCCGWKETHSSWPFIFCVLPETTLATPTAHLSREHSRRLASGRNPDTGKFQALCLQHQHSKPKASPIRWLLPGCAPLGLPCTPLFPASWASLPKAPLTWPGYPSGQLPVLPRAPVQVWGWGVGAGFQTAVSGIDPFRIKIS